MKAEEYIFDYLEGNLDAPAVKKFQQWLVDDPKRVEQLREWEQAYLPGETILYKHKESLKKPARNWTAYKWAASVSLLALGTWGALQWTQESVQITESLSPGNPSETPMQNETEKALVDKTEVVEPMLEAATPSVIASIPQQIDPVEIPKQITDAETIIKEVFETSDLLDQTSDLLDQTSDLVDGGLGLSNKDSELPNNDLDLSNKVPIYVKISVTNPPKKSRKPVRRLLALIDNIQDFKKIKL